MPVHGNYGCRRKNRPENGAFRPAMTAFLSPDAQRENAGMKNPHRRNRNGEDRISAFGVQPVIR